ncbi:MAG: hypothetical protein IJ719_00975 [Clostridia bacterium]|nr:hypothetical protein [Clostridia bacterium]
MGKLVDFLFTLLLGWVRSFANTLWSVFNNDRQSVLQWVGKYWLPIAAVLIAVGLLGDWIIWLIRWRPYHLWAIRFRKILGISDEEVREMNKEKAWVEPEPQPQPEPEPEWAYPSFTEEDVQQMDQRGSMVRDEDLGEYPGMRYDGADSLGDTQKYKRPQFQEDEQTRYQRELREYEIKKAQYDRDMAKWQHEKDMEEYQTKRAQYALDMVEYERQMAEYEKMYGKQQTVTEEESNGTSGEPGPRKRRRTGGDPA